MELFGLNWSLIYNLQDPTIIANTITELLSEPLNRLAPIKLRNFKLGKSRGAKLSDEVTNLMFKRDSLKNREIRTNSNNDWLEWKRMKN